MTADIDWGSYCVKYTEGTARFECDISGRSCDELRDWAGTLDTFAAEDERESDVFEVDYCRDKIDWALENQCSGAEPKCECAFGQNDWPDCTTSLANFCQESYAGCNFERLRTPAELCAADATLAAYTECEDTVSISWMEGGENDFLLTYDRESSALRHASANGYTANICALPTELADIEAGEAPGASQGCRSCAILCWAGEDGRDRDDLPPCALDEQGRVVLPE
jgi:hypothetical protein